MPASGLWIFRYAVPPDVVNEARRKVLSPQPVMTCISALVKLFQLATSDAAIWMFCAVLSEPVSRLKAKAPLAPRFGLRARIALTPFTYSCRNGVATPLAA